jgi:hypothetical protein
VFGIAAALVVAGGLSWAAVDGVVGQAIAIALVTAGLFGGLLFYFVELGMDEERERVDELDRRRAREVQREADREAEQRRRPRPRHWRRRPG